MIIIVMLADNSYRGVRNTPIFWTLLDKNGYQLYDKKEKNCNLMEITV